MNFFSQQAKAIKQTRLLVGLFLLAVIFIVVAINALFYFALSAQTVVETSMRAENWFAQNYWIYITLATVSLIAITSLFRTWQINRNPMAIISMVDATYVPLDSKNPNEKQLVNLVEEMAIASGMPIPQIFIMKNEQGLNAFVSGLKPSSAILVVTQGLLDQLSRQQMQGVIGHEFSHILNGDMRLNLRLVGVIAGILVIGQLGQMLLRGGSYGRRSYSSFSSSSNKKSGGGIVAIGLGIFIVGYVGLFFGRLIKAAISRQREFLADASAVQFTRDKSGIAGALLSIRNASLGSRLNVKSAEEVSHMCFGASTAITQKINGWLASHPPLEDRIQAIYPGFLRMQSTKTRTNKNRENTSNRSNYSDTTSGFTGQSGADSFTSSDSVTNSASDSFSSSGYDKELAKSHSKISAKIVSNIGHASPKNIERAQKLLHLLPEKLVYISRGASLEASPLQLLQLLFMVANQYQASNIKNSSVENLTKTVSRNIYQQIEQLDRPSRHALFDLAIARTEQLQSEQKVGLFNLVKKITKDCGQLTPNGLAIYAAIGNQANPAKPYQKFLNRYSSVSQSLNIFFHLLLQENDYQNTKWNDASDHLQSILKVFGVKVSSIKKEYDPINFHKSLNQLSRLNPMLKQELVLSVVDAIQVDNEIEEAEYDFLRLLCEYLDCPIPLG